MIAFLTLIPAALLPTLLGMTTLLALEGRTRVLTWTERTAGGFVAGSTLLTYAAFMANVTVGLPFSRLGFLGMWLVLMIIVMIAAKLRGASFSPSPSPSPHPHPSSRWARLLVGIFALSVAARIFLGGLVAATTPSYFDDTLNNWNIRGKLYWATQEYTLLLPSQNPGEEPSALSAYPPMLPLMKTFTATLAGTWSDGAVNVLQLAWFLAVLAIVWSMLKRWVGPVWALLGASALGSLPLFLIQGVNAYSDIAMTAHIALALLLLFQALRAGNSEERMTFLRVSLCVAALFAFVKNEGLLLYLTTYTLCLGASLVWFLRTGRLQMQQVLRTIIIFAIALALLVLPWLIFKWMHGMPFGNAKNVSGLAIAWQPGVSLVVVINAFFEGNWNLLMPLFLGLLIFQWKQAFRSPLVLLSFFVLFLWASQIMLFAWTSLSYEALFQTGYGRGLIHLMPLIVTISTILLVRSVDPERTNL